MDPNGILSLLTLRLHLLHLLRLLLLLLAQVSFGQQEQQQRSFDIDWSNNTFLKDGQPFTYIAGSLNYFRVPVEYWSDRMIKMKQAGLNAIQTYVEWRSHEKSAESGFDFNENLDLFKFIETAGKHDLLVILRPGPYICAERDMGGLPSWLLTVNPGMKLRTSDPQYIHYVTRWFNHLLPRLEPYLYNNGGPIIMMQVENEYGSYVACDYQYTYYLRDLMANLTNSNVVLFTTDGNGLNYLKCGQINGTLATIDFGPGTDVTKSYSLLRSVQPNGPLVNSEYYTGWLDHWAEPHSVTSDDLVDLTLNEMLSKKISINFYMFHGGTNFDLGAGSNFGKNLQPQPTSYDYDAPIAESGDLTSKYWKIRSTISKYYPVDKNFEPEISPKMSLITTADRSLDWNEIIKLGQIKLNDNPMTFESLGVSNGFIIYSTIINCTPSDPSLLTIKTLRDRAMVLVDGKLQGVLSRAVTINSLPIEARLGSRLDLIVENEGRINYGPYINEEKGIIGNVTLGPITITNWTHIYFKTIDHLFEPVTNELIKSNYYDYRNNRNDNQNQRDNESTIIVKGQLQEEHKDSIWTATRRERRSNLPTPDEPQYPAIFQSHFQLPVNVKPSDTFVNLSNFTRGVVSLNGHLLGKYWPLTGPQVTLYVPGVWFKPYPDDNLVVIFETLGSSSSSSSIDNQVTIQFQSSPILNGSTPFSNVKTYDYWLTTLTQRSSS